MSGNLRQLAKDYYAGKLSREAYVKKRTRLIDRITNEDATVRMDKTAEPVVPEDSGPRVVATHQPAPANPPPWPALAAVVVAGIGIGVMWWMFKPESVEFTPEPVVTPSVERPVKELPPSVEKTPPVPPAPAETVVVSPPPTEEAVVSEDEVLATPGEEPASDDPAVAAMIKEIAPDSTTPVDKLTDSEPEAVDAPLAAVSEETVPESSADPDETVKPKLKKTAAQDKPALLLADEPAPEEEQGTTETDTAETAPPPDIPPEETEPVTPPPAPVPEQRAEEATEAETASPITRALARDPMDIDYLAGEKAIQQRVQEGFQYGLSKTLSDCWDLIIADKLTADPKKEWGAKECFKEILKEMPHNSEAKTGLAYVTQKLKQAGN